MRRWKKMKLKLNHGNFALEVETAKGRDQANPADPSRRSRGEAIMLKPA